VSSATWIDASSGSFRWLDVVVGEHGRSTVPMDSRCFQVDHAVKGLKAAK
jgi:hypothetical protein